MNPAPYSLRGAAGAALLLFSCGLRAQTPAPAPVPNVVAEPGVILTPAAPDTPRINGASVFGVRPGNPLLYTLPTTGRRPITFSAENLPAGVSLDPASGRLSGSIDKAGDYAVTFHARNAEGSADKVFVIKVGETIALTPAMGWNSWNHYAGRITQALVLKNAQAMADSGLIHHGWTYVNIDDTWQGRRGGPFHAIQGNEKFPDMKSLCDSVHALGLKIGIYSTPWGQSYAGFIGGSSDNPDGSWTKTEGKKQVNKKIAPWAVLKYSFASNDAKQWAAWGFDYLKYDWNPNELPETKDMADALRASGRDIILSLSNSTPAANIDDLAPLANSWRVAGDIKASWKSMMREVEADDAWRPHASAGHFNDPDMLEIATREKTAPGLTPNEEYTHMSLWCLLSAPLLLGNDLTEMSPFTLSLLTNDEVLALDQDSLARQARPVARRGTAVVYAKPLADGSVAVGLFNQGEAEATVGVDFAEAGIAGGKVRQVRDLWRQKDLGSFDGSYSARVPAHGVVLVRLVPAG